MFQSEVVKALFDSMFVRIKEPIYIYIYNLLKTIPEMSNDQVGINNDHVVFLES